MTAKAGRRIVVAVWAGLCLAGLVATAALDAGAPPEDLEWSPAEEPTPREARTGTHTVVCHEIADRVEQDRAEAGRVGRIPADLAVPRECADEIEERGPSR